MLDNVRITCSIKPIKKACEKAQETQGSSKDWVGGSLEESCLFAIIILQTITLVPDTINPSCYLKIGMDY